GRRGAVRGARHALGVFTRCRERAHGFQQRGARLGKHEDPVRAATPSLRVHHRRSAAIGAGGGRSRHDAPHRFVCVRDRMGAHKRSTWWNMRSGWRRAYTTICSGSYSTRPISTCWAASRAIVANTMTTATIPAPVTWIEDGVTTQAARCPAWPSSCGRSHFYLHGVSVFVQKGIEERSPPPPRCGVVRAELRAEFPI